jgi:hypothetical protein
VTFSPPTALNDSDRLGLRVPGPRQLCRPGVTEFESTVSVNAGAAVGPCPSDRCPAPAAAASAAAATGAKQAP